MQLAAGCYGLPTVRVKQQQLLTVRCPLRPISSFLRSARQHCSPVRALVSDTAEAKQKEGVDGKAHLSKPPILDEPDYHHPVDAEEFRRLGYQVVDWIADYYKKLESGGITQVKPDVKPGYLRPLLPPSPPEESESFQDVMSDFEKVLMPGVMHWQAPKFFAYFPSNGSFPGMLADMLMGATNMVGFSWAAAPVSTELEMVMMDWLAQLVGLPSKFLFSSGGPGGGVIQGTSSEAVLVALLAARAKAMKGRAAEEGVKLVAYSSDQAHSAYQKACMIAGITHVRVLSAKQEDGYALQPAALAKAIAKDKEQGLIPFYYMATIGTTSSCAVDPVGELAVVAREYGLWSHVDAAYAGSAAVCQDQRDLYFKGLQEVDSYSFNPHKWLLTNFDCCAMWAADAGPIKEALSLTPVFLQGAGNALDYKDWQVPLGRRWRALKLFFVMRMYGAKRLREYIRHHITLAEHFAARIKQDPRFEIAAPQRFALVCFRLKNGTREQQEALLAQLNMKGDMFLIHTVLSGQFTLRLAIGSWGTQAVHVQEAWEAISVAADEVLAA